MGPGGWSCDIKIRGVFGHQESRIPEGPGFLLKGESGEIGE